MKLWFICFLIFFIVVFVFWSIKNEKERDTYHIVVAKYKEDISWLPKNDPLVKVYDKGQSQDFGQEPALGQETRKHPWTRLPNIGRESHTYLTYIVDNYDSLPSVVFFTQGSPDHTYGHPIEYFTGITGNCSENYHTTKGPYYTFDPDGHLRDNVNYGSDLYPCELSFYDWFTKYISSNVDPRGEITWYMGATFSVKSERILTRSKEYYMELLNQFPKDQSNPEVGHYFERSWYYMFNCHL